MITNTTSTLGMLGNPKGTMLNQSMATSFRVHCMGSMYMVGNAQFDSASAALQAYIDKFEGRTRPTTTNSCNDFYELFIKKNPLSKNTSSVDSNLKMKEKELRLQQLKADIEQAYVSFQTALRKAEADDAFRKSQQVLHDVEDDGFTSADQSPSDVGSMGTDQLITIDPYAGSVCNKSKKGHDYSYRALRARSNTMDSMPRPKPMTRIPEDNERMLTSSDRILTSSPGRGRDDSMQLTHDTIMSMDPAYDRLAEKLKRIRSRSMSPSSGRTASNQRSSDRKGPPSWIQDLDLSTHPVPSWVNGLETTLANADNQVVKGRPPPSWISDVAKSDITSGISSEGKPHYYPQGGARHQNLTDSNPPGLSFTDLLDTPKRYGSDSRTGRSHARHYSDGFTSRPGGMNSPKRNINGSRNEIMSLQQWNLEIPDEMAQRERLLDSSRLSKSLDTSLNRTASLPDDIPVPEGLKDILEKYLDPASRSANTSFAESPVARRSRSQERLPRSSSLDTLALLTGQAEPKSEITGASTIPKDGDKTDYGSKSGHHQISEHRSDNRPQSPATDHVLDGDRSWERPLPNYKSSYLEPVDRSRTHLYDRPSSPTLTGNQHPGSMEALKNMLFKLQLETPPSEISVNLGSDGAVAGIQSPPSKYSPVKSHEVMSEMLATDLNIPALKGYDFQVEPGGQSLERALLHLSRLKNLVNVSEPSIPDMHRENEEDDIR